MLMTCTNKWYQLHLRKGLMFQWIAIGAMSFVATVRQMRVIPTSILLYQ